MNWKALVFIALSTVAILSGCTSKRQETEDVKATVMRYTQTIAEGYKNLNMGALPQVAEDQQVNKVYFHMAALGEGRLRMVSQLKDIRFLEVAFSNASTAQVRTREKWDFQHVNLDTQKVERNEKDYLYEMNYELVRRGGAWKVRSAGTVSSPAGAAGRADK